jgi:hypothetical protein
MAFKNHGAIIEDAAPVLRKVIIGSSVVMPVNASVKAAAVTGLAALGTAGALVLGHVYSIVDKNGAGMLTTGVAGAALGSFAGTFTAASDNATVAQVAVLVDVSKFTLYQDNMTAAIGTTVGSNILGYHVDLSTAVTCDEISAIVGTAQYSVWGTAEIATQAVLSVYESQVFGV